MSYIPHTIETAPAASTETLTGVSNAYGFVPHLMGVMAEAPALLRAYGTIADLFDETAGWCGLEVAQRELRGVIERLRGGLTKCLILVRDSRLVE